MEAAPDEIAPHGGANMTDDEIMYRALDLLYESVDDGNPNDQFESDDVLRVLELRNEYGLAAGLLVEAEDGIVAKEWPE
jgi:hypothetical protein